jgi:hypothetical protein
MTEFDILESIQMHANLLKPYVPKRAIICMGEYLTRILAKWPLIDKLSETLPIFAGKSRDEIAKWTENRLDDYNIIGLNIEAPTNFWFDTFSLATDDNLLHNRLKDKTLHKLQNAILVSSTWDNISSGLTPAIILQLNDWNINNFAVAVMPSNSQPLDDHFNALSSIGKSLSENTPVLLIERDRLEKYSGVSRSGITISGNTIINEALEIILNQENFVNEILRLSKSYKVIKYTILPIMGASFEIYGSLENILNSILPRPLLTFDISTAKVVYVILRMPLRLKEKIPKESIGLIVAKWFKKLGNFRSIQIAEPLYMEDLSDRIDMIVLIGGFDTAKLFTPLIKEVEEIKDHAIEQNQIRKEEWNKIAKNLVGT